MNADRDLDRLSARQHGVVARRQLRALGLTARQIDSRVVAGALAAVHRGVYRVRGVPRTREQQLIAACLGGGEAALASHRSAAALWDLRGVGWPALEISVPGPAKPILSGVVVHRSAGLEPCDVTRRLGIPVTTPGRTLLDLGAVAPRLVEAAMEDALFRGLVREAALGRLLDRAGTHGRNGTAALRDLLDERERGRASTESPLEDDLVRLLRRHALPDPVRQHLVRAGRRAEGEDRPRLPGAEARDRGRRPPMAFRSGRLRKRPGQGQPARGAGLDDLALRPRRHPTGR